MKTKFVNGAVVTATLGIIAFKATLTKNDTIVIETEDFEIENTEDGKKIVLGKEGVNAFHITPAEAQRIAHDNGCGGDIGMLASIINNRKHSTLCEVKCDFTICLKDAPILDDKGNAMTTSDGKTKYEKDWLKRKGYITLELGEDQLTEVESINREVNIAALAQSRELARKEEERAKKDKLQKRGRTNSPKEEQPVNTPPINTGGNVDASGMFDNTNTNVGG